MKALLIGLFFALWHADAGAKPVDGWAAPLPLRAFKDGFQACTRPTPTGMTGFWQVSEEQVASIDASLFAFLTRKEMRRTLKLRPEQHARQYVGFLRGTRRFVYINAFPAGYYPTVGPRTARMVLLCHAGPTFWGVEYDLESRHFENLAFTGYGPRPSAQ